MTKVNEGFFVPVSKEIVLQALKKLGKTQKDMCEDLGFSQAYLSRSLKKGQLNKTWLILIAKYLNCDSDWLSDPTLIATAHSTPLIDYLSNYWIDPKNYSEDDLFKLERKISNLIEFGIKEFNEERNLDQHEDN